MWRSLKDPGVDFSLIDKGLALKFLKGAFLKGPAIRPRLISTSSFLSTASIWLQADFEFFASNEHSVPLKWNLKPVDKPSARKSSSGLPFSSFLSNSVRIGEIPKLETGWLQASVVALALSCDIPPSGKLDHLIASLPISLMPSSVSWPLVLDVAWLSQVLFTLGCDFPPSTWLRALLKSGLLVWRLGFFVFLFLVISLTSVRAEVLGVSAVAGGASMFVGAVGSFTSLVGGMKAKTGPHFKFPLLATGVGVLLRPVWSC